MTSFRKPTDAQVKEALRRIPSPQLRRAFFEGLKNPLWIVPLDKERAFATPPEPETAPDGLVRDFYWPEIGYLIRVAPEVPAEVVDILLRLGDSTNSWVRRAVFTIGASIPADQAARLKRLLKSWLVTGFGWRTDESEKIDFTVNLLTGGEYGTGVWLANVLFGPAAAASPKRSDLVLDDFWYEQGLPRVVEALGDEGLKVVLPWLVAFERGRDSLTESNDFTAWSRESIRVRSGFAEHESVEQSLIDAVRDLALREIVRSPRKVNDALVGSHMVLARKVALFAVGEALTVPGLDPEAAAELMAVAQDLLGDDKSHDDSCRIEYGELARAVSVVSPEALEGLFGFVSTGPVIGMDQLRERLGREADSTTEDLDARVEAYLDGWRHRWLSAIGAEALPTGLKSVLADLDEKLGVISEPLAPVNRVTSWTGPNSVVSQDEMAAMSPTELVAHLESWHDASDGWGPEPSHEGQGRALSAMITNNPLAVSGVGNLVSRLRPTYLRAILDGWNGAFKAGIELDWDQVADLIAAVLAHGDESSFPVEGGELDDDPTFRGAKSAAVRLLEEIGKKRDPAQVPQDAMPAFADLLIDDAADEAAWDEYDSHRSESDMDPLTIAINWQWPVRLQGLLNLMGNGKDVPWYVRARDAFASELQRNDRRGASRAVLGEGLGLLLNVDADWIKPQVPGFFGTDSSITAVQQIALTTTIAVHFYHDILYDLLSPAMIAAIRAPEPLTVGWRYSHSDPVQRIGEWVVQAVMRGHETLDGDLAKVFFEGVDPKIRGAAMGNIAWQFMHAESVVDELRDGLARVWDARVDHVRSHPEDKAELDEFYWFVRSGKFDPTWWLPRFREALELDPGLAGERYMVGKEVAAAADLDPRAALEVTKALLAGREDAGMRSWDLTQNAVPIVIARAIASGDEKLEADAVVFMNELGEAGSQDLERQVNEVLNGEITQDDVSD